MEPRDGSERACLEQMCQDFLNARTPMEILSAIDNLNPDQEDDAGAQPVDMHVGDSSRLQQMIIRPGESGGVLTRSEFELSKFCAEEKLRKKASDRLLSMLKNPNFVIKDIRAEKIRELETLIADCSRSKISEYDLWTKGDGKQEVKVFLRSLKQIVEGILADIGFKDRQYLWFEYRQMNGERLFGPANGAIWWQITVRQIGSGHVLIAIVIFQDGSWVKLNLTCEPLYGELNCLIMYPENHRS
jgi:hypothetical protein